MNEYVIKEGYYYTKRDTWAFLLENGQIRVGITDYAQKKLKGIEYLNLAEEGETIQQGKSLGEIESQKTVSEMIAPVSGIIQKHNEYAMEKPGVLNEDPYGVGWILEIECDTFADQVKNLMDASAYAAYLLKRA